MTLWYQGRVEELEDDNFCRTPGYIRYIGAGNGRAGGC
jgi:hypothetical protein